MTFGDRIVSALHSSNLEPVEGKIRDVEHVAALSGASSLGADVLRARDYDSRALQRSIMMLAHRARAKHSELTLPTARKLATAAIMEIMHWQCRRCHGAGNIQTGNVIHKCPTCAGDKVHYWSDEDRAKAAGVTDEIWRKLAITYRSVLEYAQRRDSETIGLASKRMG